MSKKVVILGGGIGGLTVAHELVGSGQDYDIHIYERNASIGGMARSGYKERNGVKLPTEYCWRIYGPNYHNLRAILRQIPLTNESNKNVHDNLVDIRDYLIADKGKIFFMNNRPKTLLDIRGAFKNVPLAEKASVLSKILYCFMISTKRLNSLDRLSWSEYINPDNTLSHDMRKYVIESMAPYLGAEHSKVNVPSVAKTLETFTLFNKPLSVMNGPTSEAWFDHWQAYLESKGVTFHLNTQVADVKTMSDTIEAITLADGTTVRADVFFCCLPVESVAKIPSLKIKGISELAKRAHQLMVGIQLYFDKKIPLPKQNTAMHIPDSPWQLVIEPQGSIWGKSYGDVADVWSIGLCDPFRPGNLIKKPFTECSYQEIEKEVWHQVTSSELGPFLGLEKVKVIDYKLWNTYVYDGTKIDTYEPKFSTNKGTYYLRPRNKTSYKNLYFATAYTQTTTDMFEMESAAESGRRAAQLLDKSVRVAESGRPILFAPYRWLDALFARLNPYKILPGVWFVIGLPIAIVLYPLVYLREVSRARP
jgi:uncharacterized protein with NAD-binding domain and iron-sulfur cluster